MVIFIFFWYFDNIGVYAIKGKISSVLHFGASGLVNSFTTAFLVPKG